jgi:REP element-mobilizing transposase RayT
MGQSLSQIYVHLVFGTKFRRKMIRESCETQLHAYIGGILKAYESPALIINSVPDHIHILFRLSRKHALCKVVEEIKKESSKWIKKAEGGHKQFQWQGGYGAFSVKSPDIDYVKKYIRGQKAHHSKKSFEDEIKEFMIRNGITEYDEKFFWTD